jgi:hypothetical protein
LAQILLVAWFTATSWGCMIASHVSGPVVWCHLVTNTTIIG